MSAPEPVVATPAVPSHEEIAVLAGAVQEGDLSPAQCALLARLVDQIGTSARLAARLAGRHRDPLWDPVLAAFAALVAGVGASEAKAAAATTAPAERLAQVEAMLRDTGLDDRQCELLGELMALAAGRRP